MSLSLAMIEEFRTRPADQWLQEWSDLPKSYCTHCRCIGRMVMWKGSIREHSCWECFNEIVFGEVPSANSITGPDRHTPHGTGYSGNDSNPWRENAVRALEDQV